MGNMINQGYRGELADSFSSTNFLDVEAPAESLSSLERVSSTLADLRISLRALQKSQIPKNIVLGVEGSEWVIHRPDEETSFDSKTYYCIDNVHTFLLVRKPVSVMFEGRKFYDSPNWDAVLSYLVKNSDLTSFLAMVAPRISERISSRSVLKLEYFSDSSQDYECLYLMAEGGIEDPDKLCELEDNIFLEVFEPLFFSYRGRVIFSLV